MKLVGINGPQFYFLQQLMMDAKEKGKIRRSNALEKQGNTKKKMEE